MRNDSSELAKALLSMTDGQDEATAAKTVRAFAETVRQRFGADALSRVLSRLPEAARRRAESTAVFVETAQELPETEIRDALRAVGILSEGADVRVTVRPELVGGIRIRRGGTLIDATVRRKLDKLSQAGR